MTSHDSQRWEKLREIWLRPADRGISVNYKLFNVHVVTITMDTLEKAVPSAEEKEKPQVEFENKQGEEETKDEEEESVLKCKDVEEEETKDEEEEKSQVEFENKQGEEETRDEEEESVLKCKDEEEEKSQVEFENKQGEEETGDEEEESVLKCKDVGEMGEEKSGVADEIEEKTLSPVQPVVKKPAEGLNLNNEVVKMRKEVKRVRALIIRKLTRQMGALKKKKGKDTETERNQRRASRLLEEVHAMKVLSPDLVTKTALQKNLNFEQVCKNPKSTISDRAVARIATHPQFNKKIGDIKMALKAFKEERMKTGKQKGKLEGQNKPRNTTPGLPDKLRERPGEKEVTSRQEEIKDDKEGDGVLKDMKDATVAKPERERSKATHLADTTDSQRKEMPEYKCAKPPSIKRSVETVKNNLLGQDAGQKPDLKRTAEVPQRKRDEEESDLESLKDEEREYFDDSTEERFLRQSSPSEESNDDDDFFIGKVRKFKKKKREVKDGPTESEVVESRLKAKKALLQSVFCSSLSASKPAVAEGATRGRYGDTLRGQETSPVSDFKKSKYQHQGKGTQCNSGSKYKKPCHKGSHPESQQRVFPSQSRWGGQGKGDVIKQKSRYDGAGPYQQAQNQTLHPSWEASKKRKEQQGQILAFQGKKIKFDDDD
ncbi:serum response factor-binding protein 1 [Labrus bergylta]|uniref:serum response factor-binding protein 1 n=1 Tax=Labrus bergylta TaxID=56723 RepID=UPI003313AA41